MFDIERIMLGFVLFTLVFCVECWLFTPVSTASVTKVVAVKKVQQLPIEKQMQKIFDVIDEQKYQNYEAIERLTLRQARKVAKELGITQTRTQKIDGETVKKDKPKDWLIREIKQRIARDRGKTSEAVIKCNLA